MSGFIAPYSLVMDCTSQTSPNSPVPSAGKGRYYTQQTENPASSTPYSGLKEHVFGAKHVFLFSSTLLLSVSEPPVGESPADTHLPEISMGMTHFCVWCQSQSQIPKPFITSLFKKLFF